MTQASGEEEKAPWQKETKEPGVYGETHYRICPRRSLIGDCRCQNLEREWLLDYSNSLQQDNERLRQALEEIAREWRDTHCEPNIHYIMGIVHGLLLKEGP